ncbi:MAG: hypothetical protein JNL74_22785, partial [Fibrobacteres bacterium]|nr:hypothetical protein [Fibrobacterota bacterium]
VRVSVRIIDVETGIIRWGKEIKVRHPGAWGRYQAYYDYVNTDEFVADMISIAAKEIAENFYVHEKKI